MSAAWWSVLCLCVISGVPRARAESEAGVGVAVEGRAVPPGPSGGEAGWATSLRVVAGGGPGGRVARVGFPRADGSFKLWGGAAAGWLDVEVLHPALQLEAARVEIGARGRVRARRPDRVQPAPAALPLPLRLRPAAELRYFRAREQWRVSDFLLNPMVLMMLAPLLLLTLLPRLVSDAETKEELRQLSPPELPRLPEVSELFTSLFSGTPTAAAAARHTRQTKKRN